jgi:hypothetical protein
LKQMVVEYIKELATPHLKSKEIDKDQFKEIARKATDKVVQGHLQGDPKVTYCCCLVRTHVYTYERPTALCFYIYIYIYIYIYTHTHTYAVLRGQR